MGLRSWMCGKLGMDQFRAEQVELLREWERKQANDLHLIEDDPLKLPVRAASDLLDERPSEAFPQLLEMARKGSARSMVLVAWCYGGGTGVARSAEEAEHWYRLAYEAGSEYALLKYGEYLGWRGDIEALDKVYEAGWVRGFSPAVYRRIRLHLKPTMPLPERLAWKPALEWAVAEGHPGARYLLAKYLFRGWFGARGIPLGLQLVGKHFAAILRGDEDRPIVA